MEPGLTIGYCQRGFILITVMIVTAVGLLFGAGALLLFRYQCQLRIDRQHELEKVYSVRSALNFVRTYTGNELEEGMSFRCWTGSERSLQLHVKPVAQIFPDTNRVDRKHFVMENGDLQIPPEVMQSTTGWYDNELDVECGSFGVTNLLISSKYHTDGIGLTFGDLSETNNVKWWVNIGMRDTGGWLQEDYGRRYYFYPGEYVEGNTVKDVMRLCLIRNVVNNGAGVPGGRKHGWPLSMEGEKALVFQISPNADAIKQSKKLDATMSLYECTFTGGCVVTNVIYFCETNYPSKLDMGLQLAHGNVTVFAIENPGTVSHGSFARGFTIWDAKKLSQSAYDYFAKEQEIGGVRYSGTNMINGKLYAPEMRAVFEVEAASDRRGSAIDARQMDFLTKFRVMPAYQYDVFLEHPRGTKPKLATVAQKIGEWDRNGGKYSLLTYDTHGTEHKGFRYDEKHPNGK